MNGPSVGAPYTFQVYFTGAPLRQLTEGGLNSRAAGTDPRPLPTLNVDQVVGFSLDMIKAMLDGRGTTIRDLAKTNLLR
jgi:hypothetical protein